MTTYLALMLFFPLAGGLVNALAGRNLPRRLAEALACAAVGASFACAVLAALEFRGPEKVVLGTWIAAFDLSLPLSLYFDQLALALCLMITFVCGLIHLYSVCYMAEERNYARYFALLNLFVFAMLTLILAENLVLLYLGWEGVGFCSYLLIGFWYHDPANADAGRKAFITTRIGDTALMVALAWLFQLFGTLSITQLNGMGFLMPMGVITALGLLILAGAAGKSAQLPLQVWLPDAMAGPTPVSAMIHAATMVTAGVYLLARMFPLIGGSPVVTASIAVVGGLTAFYGASCGVAQRDLKRVLAYSTISQIGYMMLGVGAGAIGAATFHLLVHAFFKALLFLGAGCVITAMHHEQDIFRMGGLRRTLPLTFWCFLIGAACLAGVPLTGGFFSKDSILAALWLKGTPFYQALYFLGLATALITAFYSFRMVYLVFFGAESHPHAGHHPADVRPMELVLVPLALLGLFGGLIDLPEYLGGGFLGSFLGVKAAHGSHLEEIALQGVAGTLALAGIFAAHVRYGAAARPARMQESLLKPSALTAFLQNGWYFDSVYQACLIRPYHALARLLWQQVDQGLIDGSLDRLADGVGAGGSWLGRWTTGRVAMYLFSFAAGGALILGYLAWLSL